MNNYISILIPVFNESQNIINCVDNLNQQSCQNFEIIFVDDGSTDDSWIILNQIIKNYPNMKIKILQQQNQGAAAARLLAAKHAKYEYVLIHDCDDKISNNSIELLLKDLYTNSEIDAVLLSLKIQYKDDDNNLAYSDFKYEDDRLILTGKECFLGTINHWKIHNFACQKKTNFLKANEIYSSYNKNLDNYINNDEIIGKIQWMLCRKVIKSDAIYYYQYNEKSTTKGINKNFYKILKNDILCINISNRLLKSDDINKINKIMIMCLLNSVRLVMKKYEQNKKNLTNKKEWINEINATLQFINKQPEFKNLKFKWKRKRFKYYLIANILY